MRKMSFLPKETILQRKSQKESVKEIKNDGSHGKNRQKVARETRERSPLGCVLMENLETKKWKTCKNLRQALVKIRSFRAGGPIFFFAAAGGGALAPARI